MLATKSIAGVPSDDVGYGERPLRSHGEWSMVRRCAQGAIIFASTCGQTSLVKYRICRAVFCAAVDARAETLDELYEEPKIEKSLTFYAGSRQSRTRTEPGRLRSVFRESRCPHRRLQQRA